MIYKTKEGTLCLDLLGFFGVPVRFTKEEIAQWTSTLMKSYKGYVVVHTLLDMMRMRGIKLSSDHSKVYRWARATVARATWAARAKRRFEEKAKREAEELFKKVSNAPGTITKRRDAAREARIVAESKAHVARILAEARAEAVRRVEELCGPSTSS